MCFIIKYLIFIPISSDVFLFLKEVSTDNEYKSGVCSRGYPSIHDVVVVHYNTVDFSIIFDGMIEGMLSEYKTWQEKEWKM